MNVNHPLLIVPICLLMAACAGGGIQVMNDISGSFDSQNFSSYHKGRDTRVVILGDTLGMNSDDFARRVTAAMAGQNSGGATNFTTAPGPSAVQDFRVVLAFNSAVSGRDLCAAKAVTPSGQSSVTTVEAAWCWANSAESFVSARTARIAPDDPRFAALIAATTRDLFPLGLEKKLHESTVEND